MERGEILPGLGIIFASRYWHIILIGDAKICSEINASADIMMAERSHDIGRVIHIEEQNMYRV